MAFLIVTILITLNVSFLIKRLSIRSEVKRIQEFVMASPEMFKDVRLERSKPGMYVIRGTLPSNEAQRLLAERVAKVRAGQFVVLVQVAKRPATQATAFLLADDQVEGLEQKPSTNANSP